MRQAVMVVVRDHGRVLVVQRAPGVPRPGYWTPISGRIEAGESQRDAAVREVREEVGLAIAPRGKVWQCPTDDGRFTLHWWLADRLAGEVTPDPAEVAATRWIDPARFTTLSPTFADDRRFFAEILPTLAH